MEKKEKLVDDSDGSDYEEEEVFLMKKDEDFYPVKGQPGLWYKVHIIYNINNINSFTAKHVYSLFTLAASHVLSYRGDKWVITLSFYISETMSPRAFMLI
jgi:hypothetical protein